jgi:hypothetical protein
MARLSRTFILAVVMACATALSTPALATERIHAERRLAAPVASEVAMPASRMQMMVLSIGPQATRSEVRALLTESSVVDAATMNVVLKKASFGGTTTIGALGLPARSDIGDRPADGDMVNPIGKTIIIRSPIGQASPRRAVNANAGALSLLT